MRWPKGNETDKDWQRFALSGIIQGGHSGDRRFVISDELKSWDRTKNNRRGIREVLQQDAYPDKTTGGEIFSKDGWLEHIRDAALYWAVTMHRPRHIKGNY